MFQSTFNRKWEGLRFRCVPRWGNFAHCAFSNWICCRVNTKLRYILHICVGDKRLKSKMNRIQGPILSIAALFVYVLFFSIQIINNKRPVRRPNISVFDDVKHNDEDFNYASTDSIDNNKLEIFLHICFKLCSILLSEHAECASTEIGVNKQRAEINTKTVWLSGSPLLSII